MGKGNTIVEFYSSGNHHRKEIIYKDAIEKLKQGKLGGAVIGTW